MIRSHREQAVALLASALLLLLAPAAAGAVEKASLVLHWRPQAQFAGIYTALHKGFYAEEGLDLEVIPGGPDISPVGMLLRGRADYATMFLSAALRHRGEGAPIVNVGQIGQESALLLVAKRSSGIERLDDLDGARVGTWNEDFQIQPRALFAREGLDVEMVRVSPSFELFMRGGVEAVTAMWYNEYHTLLSYGLTPSDLTTFFFSDLGLDIPEDGFYCLESTWEHAPETARKLVSATLRGWEYAFDHPGEALEIVLGVMKRCNIRANRMHQKWMLSKMEEIIRPDDADALSSELRRGDFEFTSGMLRDCGLLDKPMDYKDFCRGPAR